MRVLGRGAAPLLAALRRVTGVDLLDRPVGVLRAARRHDRGLQRARRAGRGAAARRRRPRSCSSPPPQTRADRGGDLVPPHAARERAAVRRRGRQPRPPRPARRPSDPAARRGGARRRTARARPSSPRGWPRTSTITTCSRGATTDNIARLAAELGGRPLLLVPHLDDDVHDVDGLLQDAPLPVRLRRGARAADRRPRGLAAQRGRRRIPRRAGGRRDVDHRASR